MEVPVEHLFTKIGKMQVELEFAYQAIQQLNKRIDDLTKPSSEDAAKPSRPE